jgi:glycosyltransferase involved in cell wall biosynthesis
MRAYDLVHIHALFSYPSNIAAWIAGKLGVPYVIRPLGVLNRWGMTNRRPGLKRLSFAAIESRLLANAAAVQFTSAQEQSEAEDLYRHKRPVVIPNPIVQTRIDKDSLAQADKELDAVVDGRRMILFLSRIHPKKGIELLIPAFAKLYPDHPATVLVIAGDGTPALTSRLKDLARSLLPGNAVYFASFVRESRKQALLDRADVFVLPSYSENFGVAAVEAMACGVPVVVTDQVGIHPAIAAHEAGCVVSCQVNEIARTIDKLLRNPTLRSEMGQRGRQLVAMEYSADAVAGKLLTLYSSVLS